MNMRCASRSTVISLIVSTVSVLAQTGDPTAGEMSVYGGVNTGSLGTHPTVGGSVGRAFSPYCIALIDTSYLPLSSYTLQSYHGIVVSESRLYDFNFTMHVRVPLRQRWSPYAIVGAAFLFNTYDKHVIESGTAVFLGGKSHAAFGFETGAGARYYLNENWGVRSEYRFTASGHSFSRVLAGFFYEFEGDFPFLGRHRSRYGQPR